MSDQQLRQAFLKDPSGSRLRGVRIGVVGLGGGGSQVAKFLGQAGCTTLTFFDADTSEGVNRNRTDGITTEDVKKGTLKVEVARRLLRMHDAAAADRVCPVQWQEAIEELAACEIIVGCIDSFAARRDLERAARQQLSPYVDIGLDVHVVPDVDEAPRMAGQVILSLPGGHCMRCMNFLTEAKLAQEASDYGGHRGREQVGWGNGVLAATAAGIVVELITGWSRSVGPVYLQYDGNVGTLTPHERLKFMPGRCDHFSDDDVGPAQLRAV
jgi:molybdopterin/thiamine biosynthesis adenylyltransferase